MHQGSSYSVDLFISDQSQFGLLRDFLTLAAPGIQVSVSSEEIGRAHV